MDRFALPFMKSETPKFLAGNLMITQNAKSTLPHAEILTALKRHILGDWGDLEAEDKTANEAALMQGGRLFSAYRTSAEIRFWIITEADRSYTTVLLPKDY
jgi:hypothetical protein